MLKLIFSDDPFPSMVEKTLFLAGPNDRLEVGDPIRKDTWRHRVVNYLDARRYDLTVFIPFPKEIFYGDTLTHEIDYSLQIQWELDCLDAADIILFYVERTEKNLGLTTNIEFGRYIDSGRIMYCRPNEALNIRYLDQMILARNKKVYYNLHSVLEDTVSLLGEGALRVDGEARVPLLFWKSEQFQSWYSNLKVAGNRLDGFIPKLALTCNNELFAMAAHVNVYVKAEDRNKSNEWLFGRTLTSYTVPYYIDENKKRHYVLIREFRSPVNNSAGYVYEFPGGSSSADISPQENAAKELKEECGLEVHDITRFNSLGTYQSFATFSIGLIAAYSIELDKDEFLYIKNLAENSTILGENEEEKITLHLATEKELLEHKYPIDLVTYGLLKLTDRVQSKKNTTSFNSFLSM